MLTFPFVENLMSCFSQLCNKKILLNLYLSIVYRILNCLLTITNSFLFRTSTFKPNDPINSLGSLTLLFLCLMMADTSLPKYENNPAIFDLQIWSHNINGSHLERIDSTLEEALKNDIHVVCLQETKMKKEEEDTFNFEEIHRFFYVKVDNLNKEERVRKRDNKRTSSVNQLVRAPQQNPPGSEGILITVRRRHKDGPPLWPTTFHTHPSHRIITAVVSLSDNHAVIIHNLYAPNLYSKSKAFYEQLMTHNARVKGTIPAQKLTIIFAGDFNATIEEADTKLYDGGSI